MGIVGAIKEEAGAAQTVFLVLEVWRLPRPHAQKVPWRSKMSAVKGRFAHRLLLHAGIHLGKEMCVHTREGSETAKYGL